MCESCAVRKERISVGKSCARAILTSTQQCRRISCKCGTNRAHQCRRIRICERELRNGQLPICLRTPYEMSGTDIAWEQLLTHLVRHVRYCDSIGGKAISLRTATRCLVLTKLSAYYCAISSIDRAISLRTPYAMSGTETA
eukprot:3941018-Rhodomonas_salina.1